MDAFEPSTEVKRAVDRVMKKTGPGLYPPDSCQCSAPVRIYVNRRLGGNWVRCSKRPRKGKRTCHWHRAYEDD